MPIFLIALAALLVYFLPSLIAMGRRHLNATAIYITNLFFGLTVIGWIIPLIWSFTNAPVAPHSPRPMKALKIIFTIIFSILLLLLWGLGSNRITMNNGFLITTEAPAVKTGVPMPAEELLGK